jgi:hypothetical protein
MKACKSGKMSGKMGGKMPKKGMNEEMTAPKKSKPKKSSK